MMGMVQDEFVQRNKMLTDEELQRIFSLTNMFPGPLVVNTITMIGYKTGGWLGGLIAFLLILFPGPILVTVFVVVLHLYVSTQTIMKISLGVTPVIIALLIEFIIKSYKSQKRQISSPFLYLLLFILTLILLFVHLNIALVFLLAIIFLGLISKVNFRGFVK